MPGYKDKADQAQGVPLYAIAPTSDAEASNLANVPNRTTSPATNRESTAADRIGKLIRHNSSIVAGAAETVVVPKNRRSVKQAGKPTGDVEAGVDVVTPVEKKFPFFIVLISILEIFMFYVTDNDTSVVETGLWYDPYRRHELWRFFTVMLVHSSASHLWGNIIFQLILGCLLEIVHHWRRVGIVYLCGVLGGSLAVTVIDPKSYAVGASAGVYALLASHLVTLIMNWQEMERRICRLFWLLLYIAFDIALAFLVSAASPLERNTSHAGHFGGALAGFLIGVCVLKNFRTLAWEMTFRKICIGIAAALVTIVVIVNISFPSHYYPTEFNTHYVESILKRVCKEPKVYESLTEACQGVMTFPDNHTVTATT